MTTLKKLLVEEEAQGLVEYILIVALVAVAVVVTVRAFGGKISSWFNSNADKLDKEIGAGQ